MVMGECVGSGKACHIMSYFVVMMTLWLVHLFSVRWAWLKLEGYMYTQTKGYMLDFCSLVAMDTCYLGKFVKSYHLHIWNGYSR